MSCIVCHRNCKKSIERTVRYTIAQLVLRLAAVGGSEDRIRVGARVSAHVQTGSGASR